MKLFVFDLVYWPKKKIAIPYDSIEEIQWEADKESVCFVNGNTVRANGPAIVAQLRLEDGNSEDLNVGPDTTNNEGTHSTEQEDGPSGRDSNSDY
tara:strand:+ start:8742 stop:9026 length:285 start_codon:yes stop_codon:yes gene_type:complete